MRAMAVVVPIFAAAFSACTSATPVSQQPETSPTEAVPPADTAAPSNEALDPLIELGELSLTWDVQEVGEGIKPALSVDDEGIAHVAFLTEADHGRLFYANNRDGEFDVETVAEGYFYGPVDIALGPEGDPFIAYHDHQGLQVDPALGDAVVAHLGEGGWELTPVTDDGHDGWDNSIAVDNAGNWHAAGVDPSQFGGDDGVEYATISDEVITVSAVGSGPIKYEFGTSVQIDSSGSPAVAYYNDRDQQLEVSFFNEGNWSVEVVDNEGDAGRFASLVFGPDGMPHVAYYVSESSESGTVRHAWKDASGWQIENVGILQNLRMGHVGARKITSLAFDPVGNLHLAYTDRDQLIYAQKTEDGWVGQDVIEPESRILGQLVELAIDADGNPHLTWFEAVQVSPSLEGIVRYAAGGQ